MPPPHQLVPLGRTPRPPPTPSQSPRVRRPNAATLPATVDATLIPGTPSRDGTAGNDAVAVAVAPATPVAPALCVDLDEVRHAEEIASVRRRMPTIHSDKDIQTFLLLEQQGCRNGDSVVFSTFCGLLDVLKMTHHAAKRRKEIFTKLRKSCGAKDGLVRAVVLVSPHRRRSNCCECGLYRDPCRCRSSSSWAGCARSSGGEQPMRVVVGRVREVWCRSRQNLAMLSYLRVSAARLGLTAFAARLGKWPGPFSS
jgi:hypothetical protein